MNSYGHSNNHDTAFLCKISRNQGMGFNFIAESEPLSNTLNVKLLVLGLFNLESFCTLWLG